MRNTQAESFKDKEYAIVNLDLNRNSGTHWVDYINNGNFLHYSENSFGDVKPLRELITYFNMIKAKHNVVYQSRL